MHLNRFEEQSIIRARQTVLDTARDGLPTGPVMSKALEGMAKKVSQEQVIAAMEAVRSRHNLAFRLAQSLSDDITAHGPLTQVITDSLAAGMTAPEMEKILSRLNLPTRRHTRNQAENLSLQTLLTVRSMMRLGAMSKDVSNTVCHALQHRNSPEYMEQFRQRFVAETRNTPARQLAHEYSDSMDNTSSSIGGGSGEHSGPAQDGSVNNGPGGSGSDGNESEGNSRGGNGSGSGDSNSGHSNSGGGGPGSGGSSSNGGRP
jgi:hypothetical protein